MNDIYTTILPYVITTAIITGSYLAWRYKELVKRLLVTCFILASVSAFGYISLRSPIIKEVPKIVEVEKPEESLEELLEEIPRTYGMSRIVVEEVIKKESDGNSNAIRFEAHHMSRAAKFTRNPDEQRMYASSHGLMQVMAWHLPPMGLRWIDLHDKRTNVEVGTKILSDCYKRQKGSKWEKYHGALTCYNGSGKYADDVMNKIGRRLAEGVL
jgi:soluble lytic murein transglycosylase-like protein